MIPDRRGSRLVLLMLVAAASALGISVSGDAEHRRNRADIAGPGAGPEAAPASPSPAATGDRIVIGSKNFTESHILGEMLALLVQERTGLSVEHRSGLGGTLVCHAAIRAGEIDLYPEYTGTAWSVVLKERGRPAGPLETYLRVREAYRALFDLEWMDPLGFDNTYALAMREDLADELGIRTISDLARHAGGIAAGFSIEFMNREDGWPGLRDVYGLHFRSVSAMEHSLAYEAVSEGAIDVLDAYSTDGKLLRFPLRVLADDRAFFPPYDAAPVVRGETLRAHPELREVLGRLAFRIPAPAMARLNYRVEEEGRGFREVAREFLLEEGLLEAAGATGRRAEEVRDATSGRASFAGFLASRWRETLRLGWEHIQLTLAAVLLAVIVAVPLGILACRSRIGGRIALGGAGVVQTIPSLALLAFMIAIPGLGLSARSAIVALFLYAVLPILRNTHTGLEDIDRDLLEAAAGIGLTPRQILLRVQLPLAIRTIMAGVRTATVISIGVATLAAFIGAGGLGEPIVTGLYLNDTWLILSGAIPAALLALAADALLGRLEWWLTPRGLRI